jgi:hypothetical protein
MPPIPRDAAVAIGILLTCLLGLAILSWIGYVDWETIE